VEKQRKKVLFLCTGNSCRSQIAEAIANARFSDEWQAFSAGTHPSGFVHPLALQVLAEWDILHQGRSKNVYEFRDVAFDLVVTVCDDAAEECPVWLGPGKRIHYSIPDPAKATGSDEKILNAFRGVRDKIATILSQQLNTK
jgi:arsenate reductase